MLVGFFSIHKVFVVSVLYWRSHYCCWQKGYVPYVVQEGELFYSEMFLLLREVMFVSNSVFYIVGKERIFTDQNHHECDSIH